MVSKCLSTHSRVTLNEQGKNKMTHYIGIDISKAKLDTAWLKDPETLKVKTKVFKNNPKDFEQLLNWITSNISNELNDIHISLEATSVYHENIAHYLHEKGIKVSIVNPAFVRSYANSLGSRNKTDKKDSIILARYTHSAKPEQWQPPAVEVRQLNSLLTRLQALQEDLQREKNRQEKALATNTAPKVLESIETMILTLEEAIDNLNKDIDEHIGNYPDLKQNQKLLQTIKGVGTVISRHMLCLLKSKTFTSASQVAAFLGLVPRHTESGLFKGKSRLAKNGSSLVRSKLYMAAIVASKHNSIIKAHYERVQNNGKCKKQAICACMRKLVHICFGVIKHQKPFQTSVG